MKNWLALGLLCVVAPMAHANDLGVVSKFEGSHVIVTSAFLRLRAGEEVTLSVIPERNNGTGRAVVTDVDPYTHQVALAILPLKVSGEASTSGMTYGGFRINREDTVKLQSRQSFMKDLPEYHLDRPAVTPVPDHVDIEMPEGFVVSKSAAAGGASATPAGALPARRGGPDMDSILRSLPNGLGGLGGQTPTESTSETPDASPVRTPSRIKTGNLQTVAMAFPAKHRTK